MINRERFWRRRSSGQTCSV
ncbi:MULTISPECIES: hypothetical protein [Caulobacter]|uniref:Uncharacterized protein n=3 Tax=Caulobacter TaxID=75 RepID=A0A0H3J489_CAUVN|nr:MULTISPECIES: hypothetical protein [Caulobacter]YP_009020536.1 hypothetical protein CCNA_03964 [Caulobacter vibrioides NA1000]MCA0355802.1 hypothetical protein [Pseudomonadota bacterium]HWT52609.1 hypothetical protein [Caulobacter sp.]AHI88567.1 hypothetical protein CCNA_03964 [Caulobacter vibrioides NA1000]AWC68713.1 hypothetical protein CA606_20270 [Caulobacter vibrioides]AZS23384.1 hypothetical protein CSW63_09535 [Caulobacter sp. FWC26]